MIRSFIGRFITAEKIEATKELFANTFRLGSLSINSKGNYEVDIGSLGSLKRVYVAPNSVNDNQQAVVGPMEQILLGAQFRHTVSYTGKIADSAFRKEEFAWDHAYRETTAFSADTDCVIEVVFSTPVVLGEGIVTLSFFGDNKPDVSMSLEVRKNSIWTETKSWSTTELSESSFFTEYIAQNEANPYEGIRLNFRGTQLIYLTSFENYLTKGDGDYPLHVLSSTPGAQAIYSPSIVIRNFDASNSTTIGQGTINATSIPEYANDSAADAALSSGDFYTVTGDRSIKIIP